MYLAKFASTYTVGTKDTHSRSTITVWTDIFKRMVDFNPFPCRTVCSDTLENVNCASDL